MELEGIINCSMCWRMVTHWLAGDNLLAEIFVCFLLFMIFFSVLLLYCVVCAPYALHSATFTHIVFDDFVVFRWSFVCFVCVWEWSVVRTSERCYRNIFIFFFFIRHSSKWTLTHTSTFIRHSLIPYAMWTSEIRHEEKCRTKNCLGDKRNVCERLVKTNNRNDSKFSRDKYDIQRPFANYDGLFIPVAVIYNFNWPSKRLQPIGSVRNGGMDTNASGKAKTTAVSITLGFHWTGDS